VRENRTPGSVRGLPGNWQSYRDQLAFDAHDVDAQFLSAAARSVLLIRSPAPVVAPQVTIAEQRNSGCSHAAASYHRPLAKKY